MTAIGIRREDDGVCLLTLDRPPANAFDPEFVATLRRAMEDLAGARALVLASANPRLFSAGWDLPRLFGAGREEMRDFVEGFCGLVRDVFAFGAPVVAALPGHAIAGGLILASAADERYAAEGPGKFGLSEVALGVPLPASCMEVFRYVLGARAMERLTATGETMTGEPARAFGLLDRVVPGTELLGTAVERARALSRGSGAAYAAIKRRARAEALASFDRARQDDPFLDYWFGQDARERVAALVEKLTGKRPSSSLSS